ncbi:DUF5994 family protein [Mycolicibacterium houstonense]|uniref:DUF5994 family protein n=1 Tax=Mycolicibacterium houstonense TaxID=146021 RepID=UPI000A5C2D76
MNGLTGARRLASPVRIALADQLGADIDGAWWPHTASVAGELPELVGALHPSLGEVVDIRINWSAAEGQLDLNTIVTGNRWTQGRSRAVPGSWWWRAGTSARNCLSSRARHRPHSVRW